MITIISSFEVKQLIEGGAGILIAEVLLCFRYTHSNLGKRRILAQKAIKYFLGRLRCSDDEAENFDDGKIQVASRLAADSPELGAERQPNVPA